MNVPTNASDDWKRLAPTSFKGGKFPNSNVWAVDILSVDSVCTLRLVRTSASAIAPASSVLSIKILARLGEPLRVYTVPSVARVVGGSPRP